MTVVHKRWSLKGIVDIHCVGDGENDTDRKGRRTYLVSLNVTTTKKTILHVGYTSFHSNFEVKQHWAYIVLGQETLQRISGSAGTPLR